MSAARLNSRALTVRGTLPQIGSFSLGWVGIRLGGAADAVVLRWLVLRRSLCRDRDPSCGSGAWGLGAD